jgi:hypothetical protein
MDEQPLTRLASPLTMGWCLDCHRDHDEQLVARADVFDPGVLPGTGDGASLVDRRELLTNCSACHY